MFPEAIQYLEKLGNDIFLTSSPDILDFTLNKPISLIIETNDFRLNIPFPVEDSALRECCGTLCHYLENKIIIGWDSKNIFSYILGKLGNSFNINSTIYDLNVLEGYIGIEGNKPTNFQEARKRLGKIIHHSSWKNLKNIYLKVYNPLICKIIPEIETVGVVHQKQRKKLHACYTITGQSNGRMKCQKGYEFGFNPHSVSIEDRIVIRPPFFDHMFMYLDFKHMEVSMLQWLSEDKNLEEILESGVDPYEAIWTIITGLECDESKRQKCKDIFLPVVFGMGVDTLSEKIGISKINARRIIDQIQLKFYTAMNWIKRQQDTVEIDGNAVDIYGRIRIFLENVYKSRNFFVQSPAALFCLDKLVVLKHDLQNCAYVIATVHDGYVLSVHRKDISEVRDMAIKSLEKESEFFHGLKLHVTCKTGVNLENLL